LLQASSKTRANVNSQVEVTEFTCLLLKSLLGVLPKLLFKDFEVVKLFKPSGRDCVAFIAVLFENVLDVRLHQRVKPVRKFLLRFAESNERI
jgi:hypothetical protein